MDSDRRSAQVERLEVVETGRRRSWSEDEKLKIVLESLQASRQVAATARRYGISRSLLLRWRRLYSCIGNHLPVLQCLGCLRSFGIWDASCVVQSVRPTTRTSAGVS
jgi:transposase-like protein